MSLTEFLKKTDPILMDGAMGTQLAIAGLEMGGQNCVSHPDEVISIHKRYKDAGCHILIANTFTMNRIYIESHGVDVDVREVNLAGARLAKTAAGDDQYVLGDIGSTGKMLEPFGDLKELNALENYKEQAILLAEGGVDGFIIETMIDLNEALLALRGIKEVSELPVIASLSYSSKKDGGRTIMGNAATDSAKSLEDEGASVIGANCGDLDPFEMTEVVSTLKQATALPIIAQPNAGKPRLVGEDTVFDMPPEEFAHGLVECHKAGARLLGGCCGTSPEHIAALVKLLNVG
jgi:5-methyltetrahydrofolate--homocysteine methyltransferase